MLPRGLSLSLTIMGCLVACGGATSADVADAATDAPSAADASPPVTATPPVKPSGPTTGDASTKTFAIQRIFLGDTSRTGGPADNRAWKKFGYDLDGKVTNSTSSDVCTRAKGAPSSNQVDGDLGSDNAFGAVVLPILESVSNVLTLSEQASAEYQTGKSTHQIFITGLGDDPTQTAIGLGGGVFASLAYRGDSAVDVPFPGFGPTTDWPVRVEGLADGVTIAGGPKVAFGDAYVSNGTFVSGGSLDLTVAIPFGINLVIHHAIVTFDHTAPGTAANGTIAGVLDTEELITGMKMGAGRLSTSLCGSQFDGIAQQLRQASDIMVDLSNTAGASCDGISIGLGFEATLVANPTQIAKDPVPVVPDPCFPK